METGADVVCSVVSASGAATSEADMTGNAVTVGPSTSSIGAPLVAGLTGSHAARTITEAARLPTKDKVRRFVGRVIRKNTADRMARGRLRAAL